MSANPELNTHGSQDGCAGETGELPSRRWWALAVIAIAQLMVVLDGTVVTIALPSAQADLGFSDADRQWVITAYTLAFGGLLLLGGRIGDYAGRKRAFLIGLIGFAVASILGGAAQNAATLFGARALQGMFAALLAPAALSLITVTFTEAKERSRAFAVYGAIAGAGAAIGLILGGALTEYTSWRWCLYINVPIAVVAFIGGTLLVTESKSHGKTSYDIPGAILGTAGLVALVYGFTASRQARGRLALRGDPRPSRGRRRPAGRVRARRTALRESTAADAGRAGPQSRRIVHRLTAVLRRHVRDVPVPELTTCRPTWVTAHSKPDSRSSPSVSASSSPRARCPPCCRAPDPSRSC